VVAELPLHAGIRAAQRELRVAGHGLVVHPAEVAGAPLALARRHAGVERRRAASAHEPRDGERGGKDRATGEYERVECHDRGC
jgi:hypothetical protein